MVTATATWPPLIESAPPGGPPTNLGDYETGAPPKADQTPLDPAQPIRDQLDLDSMDFMNFLMEIDREVHVDVPETDYARVATLDQCVANLSARLPS